MNMIRLIRYGLVFTIVLCLPSNVFANKWKPYFSISAGFHLPKTTEFYHSPDFEEYQSSKGLAILAAFGLRKKYFRFEVEYGLRLSNFKIPTNGITGGAGSFIKVDLATSSLFANGYYHLRKKRFLSPYLGLGFGVVRQTLKGLNHQLRYTDFHTVDPSLAYHFAWQGMVGNTIRISRSFASDLEYRYFSGGIINAHGANISLRYLF